MLKAGKFQFVTISILIAIVIFSGCSKKSNPNPTPPSTAPTITSLSVNQGPYNTSVVITGTNFSTTAANDVVSFNGKVATVSAATTTQLTVAVPLGAGTGKVTLSVSGGNLVTGPIFTYQLSLIVSTLAGDGTQGSVDGQGTTASFYNPKGIVADVTGNIYVADVVNNKVRKITPAGVVSTYAGNGSNAVDNGSTTTSNLAAPYGLAIDASGNLYVTEVYNDEIRKITPAGVVSTFAGSKFVVNTVTNAPPADGLGTAASFYGPGCITFDASGNLFVPDGFSNRIRKVTPAGLVTTIAGNSMGRIVGQPANGAAAFSTFDSPNDIAVDGSGNLYIADGLNSLIRVLTTAGQVSTLAGSGNAATVDGTGAAASFHYCVGIATDKSGNFIVAETNAIRKVTPAGVVTTIAGTGAAGHADGPALSAMFKGIGSLAIDANGTIYVTDATDNTIRKISMQ